MQCGDFLDLLWFINKILPTLSKVFQNHNDKIIVRKMHEKLLFIINEFLFSHDHHHHRFYIHSAFNVQSFGVTELKFYIYIYYITSELIGLVLSFPNRNRNEQ